MKLQESGEMYLETIYLMLKEKPYIRSVDIADAMNYSKPSVSRAVHLLKTEGYIDMASDGQIVLTERGKAVAKKTYERHEVFTELFCALGVDKTIAENDACRIEHVISDETFEAVKKHTESFKKK